jgi:hypothetical protein
MTTENNDIPPGKRKFENETGIKDADWFGKHWARWSDAIKEAGFIPNKMNAAYDENWLIEQFIALIRETKKFPVTGDLRLKARNTKNFPESETFNRLGTIAKRANKILNYCEGKSDYQDVVEICRNYIASLRKKDSIHSESANTPIGYVYLMKSGRYYKIGRSNIVEKRKYEIGIKLPEELKSIHEIKTDDPNGIEAYWHNRFKDKRKQGEWFDLSASDVNAFKKWKRIA